MGDVAVPCIGIFVFGFLCLMDIANGHTGAAAFDGFVVGANLILLIDAIQDLREIKRLQRSHGRPPLSHHQI
jgi:hypothetical protein